MRARTNLNGSWQFWPDVAGKLATDSLDRPFMSPQRLDELLGPSRTISVPGPWQSQFDDLRLWWGTAWYGRDFTVERGFAGRSVRICFGAVDYYCIVWINGSFAGAHEGGYLPFDFNITKLLHASASNTVIVEVRDPGRESSTGSAAPFDFEQIPHGKQSWYGPAGGLWQDVFLEASAPNFIRSARIWPDNSGAIALDVNLSTIHPRGTRLECDVAAPGGGSVVASHSLEPETPTSRLQLHVDRPRLWGPDDPSLYALRLKLVTDEADSDRYDIEFGFRSIGVDDGRIVLNGRPIYLSGALDQDFYPETISTPPSAHYMLRQMTAAKEMGLNLLRCHIKVPDPRYLRIADRIGLLVWAELPNWGRLTEAAQARARATFEGMVHRDANHPCIVIWSLINESWGVDLSDAAQRRWLADLYLWAKDLDPSRLVVDNSACAPNFHMVTDINDFHFYRAFPDHEHDWDRWTADWTAHPESSYSPHGDAQRRGTEPLVLSEFGSWGLPELDNILTGGREPWWFATGSEWGRGSVVAKSVRERFSEWKFDDVFGSWDELAKASQENEFRSLRHAIQNLRSHPQVAGHVITEFTDVAWESNGLLDFARNPKTFSSRLKEINAPDILIIAPGPRRLWSGEIIQIEPSAAVYSEDITECSLEWMGAGLQGGSEKVGRINRGVTALPAPTISLPTVERPEQLSIEFRLRSNGRTIAMTSADLVVCPRTPAGDPAAEIPVVEGIDQFTRRFIENGGRAIVVATREDALDATGGLTVQPRAGTVWEGDWAQGLHWMRPLLLGGARMSPALTSVWAGLIPELVLCGYGAEHAADMMTGYFVGWLHHVVATTGRLGLGNGSALVTTFPVLEPYGSDPLATWFLNRLKDLARGPTGARPRAPNL